jgi:hypothetical protein
MGGSPRGPKETREGASIDAISIKYIGITKLLVEFLNIPPLYVPRTPTPPLPQLLRPSMAKLGLILRHYSLTACYIAQKTEQQYR